MCRPIELQGYIWHTRNLTKVWLLGGKISGQGGAFAQSYRICVTSVGKAAG